MPSEVLAAALLVIAALIAAWLLWRVLWRRLIKRPTSASSLADTERPTFPAEGLLVSEQVLQSTGIGAATIWEALDTASAPVAIEYRPIAQSELIKYRAIPVNATAQQSLAEIVKMLNPKNPTLFRVLLPHGEKLVKAAGQPDLYRGWAHNGVNISAQALLKPVAAGGAIAAGWPMFAVAGAVMAVDMVAQREQRAHQRKLETILGRQEERYYSRRIAAQKTADKQLSRAIQLMLDGRDPQMEVPLKDALDEFHDAQQFLDKYKGAIERITDDNGKVDYRQLDEVLGGKTKDVDYFIRELHLARAALAIRRKALIADAAAAALADPTNPYAALRQHFEQEAGELEAAELSAETLITRLSHIQLKGRWQDGITSRLSKDRSVAAREERLRAQIGPAASEGEAELLFVVGGTGELRQLVEADDVEIAEPAPSE
ncbi:hypothetical protein ACF044_02005 [Microbacterium sp. NPDC016588]